jgi:two-component system sensor histidine kinase UhpB
VDSWGAHHSDCVYKLDLPTENQTFDEEVSLTGYRIIQECLTNVARHSKARAMHIKLRYVTGGSKPNIHILIEDNGIGLPAGFRSGFGCLGMSERVRKLGGSFRIANGLKAGTVIEAIIPAVPQAAAQTLPQRLENILVKG